MNPKNTLKALEGLWVSVDEVTYQPEADTPPDRPYCFVYHITIHNDSTRVVTIKGRKWVVRSSEDDVTAVEGDGVVGQRPTLEPGEHFTYNSYHLLDTQWAVAEGSYIGTDENGEAVLARIPPFRMDVVR